MSETLTIRNFGPVENVTIELKVVNILIGDQGTGKSTIAKLLDIIKASAQSELGDLDLYNNGEKANEQAKGKFKNEQFSKTFFELLKEYELQNYLNKNTFLAFENSFFRFSIEGDTLKFQEKNSTSKQSQLRVRNTNSNFYIPAFREAFILLRNNYPAILKAKADLPFILNSFGQEFNNYRENIKHFDFKHIVGIDYSYLDGRDLILLENGKTISFEEASSAINSLVPLLVVFSGIVSEQSQEGPRVYYKDNFPFVTIEEPELNCFPDTQREVVKYLVEKIKFKNYQDANNYYCNLIITTHSPYILTSLNNLMYAYSIGQENKEEVGKIVEEKYWLNPDDVSVYKLLNNGHFENIMDEELRQIKVEKIDEISEVLSNQWHELANLNFAKS